VVQRQEIQKLDCEIDQVREELDHLDEVGIKQPEMKEEIFEEKKAAAARQDDLKEGA